MPLWPSRMLPKVVKALYICEILSIWEICSGVYIFGGREFRSIVRSRGHTNGNVIQIRTWPPSQLTNEDIWLLTCDEGQTTKMTIVDLLICNKILIKISKSAFMVLTRDNCILGGVRSDPGNRKSAVWPGISNNRLMSAQVAATRLDFCAQWTRHFEWSTDSSWLSPSILVSAFMAFAQNSMRKKWP